MDSRLHYINSLFELFTSVFLGAFSLSQRTSPSQQSSLSQQSSPSHLSNQTRQRDGTFWLYYSISWMSQWRSIRRECFRHTHIASEKDQALGSFPQIQALHIYLSRDQHKLRTIDSKPRKRFKFLGAFPSLQFPPFHQTKSTEQ